MLRVLPALLLAALLVLPACSQDEGPYEYEVGEPVQDSTIALIALSEDGATDTLSAGDFQGSYQSLAQRFRLRPGQDTLQARELRRRLAENFVIMTFLDADTLAQGWPEVTEEAVDMELNTLVQQRFGSMERFEQALAQRGLTIDSIRADIRRDADQGVRRRLQLVRLGGGMEEVTAAEIDSVRTADTDTLIGARHILLQVPQGGSPDSVRAEAATLIDSLEAGADFAALARRHSEGPSAPSGGDLGFFSRGQMVPAFEETAFALADSGDVASEPVRTQFGYHIVQLTGRRVEQPSEEDARLVVLGMRQEEAVERGLERLKTLGTVRLNPAVVQADLNDAFDPTTDAPEAATPTP